MKRLILIISIITGIFFYNYDVKINGLGLLILSIVSVFFGVVLPFIFNAFMLSSKIVRKKVNINSEISFRNPNSISLWIGISLLMMMISNLILKIFILKSYKINVNIILFVLSISIILSIYKKVEII